MKVHRRRATKEPFRISLIEYPLWMRYQNQGGEISERTVIMKSAEWVDYTGDGPDLYLTAFCRMRGEERMFRVDRIISSYDPNTGEIIADLWEWLIALGENEAQGIPLPIEPLKPFRPSKRPQTISKSRHAETDHTSAVMGGMIGGATIMGLIWIICHFL